MKKLFILLLSAALLAACQESLEDRAARELKEYTERSCPTPVVNYQRTDSAVFEPSTRTIHYYMKFCEKADSAEFIKAHAKELRSALLKDLKMDTQKKAYKDAGFTFRYTFRSEKHPEEVLLDVVSPPKRVYQ